MTLTSGLTATAISVPLAGLGFAVPEHGRVDVRHKWWRDDDARAGRIAAVAAAAGIAAGSVAAHTGWSLALPAFVWSAVVGVVLAVVDVRCRRLPYVLTVPMYVVGLVCFGVASAVADDYGALLRSVLAGAAVFVGFLLLALVFAGQLGLGDVVLAGGLAMSLGWLGWDRVAVGLLAGLVLQAVVAVALTGLRRAATRGMMPMGPALVAGWLIGVIVNVA